jgi:NADH-quinone oxidoreductase subunit C
VSDQTSAPVATEDQPGTEVDVARAVSVPGLEADPLSLDDLGRTLLDRVPGSRTEVIRGELTVHVTPDTLLDALRVARDELACELLADLSGVHWPAGDHVIERQPSTTGWPEYRISREQGVIEVLYIVRSLAHNHWFRISVGTPDDAPRLPSATQLYPTANFHEREVYDFFGVEFDGHPDLNRILMPDDWVGHPQRKDYPLGGVEVTYDNGKFIPPPDERDLREVVD